MAEPGQRGELMPGSIKCTKSEILTFGEKKKNVELTRGISGLSFHYVIIPSQKICPGDGTLKFSWALGTH